MTFNVRLEHIEEDARPVPSTRKIFKRADFDQVWRAARSFIVERRVLRMADVETSPDGVKRLVICNLWRIDRHIDGRVEVFEFDLKANRWIETNDVSKWPDIPLAPVATTRSLEWWRDVYSAAIDKCLKAAGLDDLDDLASGKMKKCWLAWILKRHYIGSRKEDRGKSKSGEEWSEGFLDPNLAKAGARALRAMIFDHILEKQLVGAALAMDFTRLSLPRYLEMALERDAVLRVAREHRNLLPLLLHIPVRFWRRDDLFSQRVWVRSKRKRTVVDRPSFVRRDRFGGLTERFESFESKAAFRMLCRLPLTAIAVWASGSRGRKRAKSIELIARANIKSNIPAIVWKFFVDWSIYREQEQNIDEVYVHLIRVFAEHCSNVWEKEGYSAVKNIIQNNYLFFDIMDWLRAEGMARGFPDKHSTWTSLERRSHEWHMTRAVHDLDLDGEADFFWDSALSETVIDGVAFTPINSCHDLFLEGRRLHHCVGNYARQCRDGGYRVYSVLDQHSARSTLGLFREIVGDRVEWRVEQHRGPCNAQVSKHVSLCGEKFAALYDAASRRITNADARR